MKRLGGRADLVTVLALCVTSLAACRDSGLPDRNLPMSEARHREFRYPAYQPIADHDPVAVAGRQYIGGLPIETIPERMMVPVGNAGAIQLYAQRGRQAPYSRVYARVGPDRFRPYVRL